VLRTGRRCRPRRADVAQLVAHHLAKVRVAGSNPVIRSKVHMASIQRWSGRVVRQRPAKPCTRVRFPSPPPDLVSPARLAQRESASLTRKRSLVQSQYRAPHSSQVRASAAALDKICPGSAWPKRHRGQADRPEPAPIGDDFGLGSVLAPWRWWLVRGSADESWCRSRRRRCIPVPQVWSRSRRGWCHRAARRRCRSANR